MAQHICGTGPLWYVTLWNPNIASEFVNGLAVTCRYCVGFFSHTNHCYCAMLGVQVLLYNFCACLCPVLHIAERYDLDPQSSEGRAHFLVDAWSGFFSKGHGEQLRREAFYASHNIEPPAKQAGGWSSHGQPCDQVHAQLRKRIRDEDLTSLNMTGDLRSRART